MPKAKQFQSPARRQDVPYLTKLFGNGTTLEVVAYERQEPATGKFGRKAQERAYLEVVPHDEPRERVKVCVLGALAEQFREQHDALPAHVVLVQVPSKGSTNFRWGAYPADPAERKEAT